MGKYRGAVVTTAGQNIIAQAIASAGTVTWTTAEASSHAYPAGTNFEALTSLQDVEQTVNISSVQVFGGNIVQVLCRFENAGVAVSYPIETIGLWARLGSDPPVLTAVVAADTADVMPVDNPESPSAFIYDIQMTIQNADSFTVTVNPAGTATAADLHEAQLRLADVEDAVAQKADLATLATVEATATASRAYAVGEYLIREGVLYEVTTAIPVAGTITPGTNVAAVTVGGELKGLDEEKADYADLATVEATATASRAYAVGEYLVYNGTLYRVTAAIASGGTITPGTNAAAVTAGSELKALDDTKAKYLNLAYVEATGTASRNYSKGDFLVWNGTFYRATVDIATGDTLTPGTNIQGGTVGGWLSGIASQIPNKTDLLNLAVVEGTNRASRAYSKGDYLVYNGLLYKASAAIASGATLVPDTNITKVKVGGQLKAINDTLAQAPVNLTFTTGASVSMGNNYSIYSPLTKTGQILAYIMVGSSMPTFPLTITSGIASGWSGGGVFVPTTGWGGAVRFTVNSGGALQAASSLNTASYYVLGLAKSS